MKSTREITVADLDPLMPQYRVYDEKGYNIGIKNSNPEWGGYLKPEYRKDGRVTGGRRSSIENRKYKATPPWFKYPVTQIKTWGLGVGVFVRSGKYEQK